MLLLAVVSIIAIPKTESNYQEMTLCQDVLSVIDRADLNATTYLDSVRTPYCVRITGCGYDSQTCAPLQGRVSRRLMKGCTLTCEVSK